MPVSFPLGIRLSLGMKARPEAAQLHSFLIVGLGSDFKPQFSYPEKWAQ